MALCLNVFTLNCWGIPFFSKNRKERMQAIANYLAEGKHNIVCLQEVWSEDDFVYIRDKIKNVLPYSHYFYSGVQGSGLCVFSAWVIEDVFFHQWTLNGYIHKVHHGDWFGGKGVGLCRLRCGSRSVHIYNTHLHAEYHTDDIYLAHRVLQAYITAEFVKLTVARADLCILAGDLNTEPGNLSYRLITQIPLLSDPFYAEYPTQTEVRKATGTSDNANNSYSDTEQVRVQPEGKRIDHILYLAGQGLQVDPICYGNPLPDRVQDQAFSYSDHNAVSFQCRLSQLPTPTVTGVHHNEDRKQTLEDAKKVCLEAKQGLLYDRRSYLLYCGSLFLLLVSTVGPWEQTVMLNFIRIVLTGLCFYCFVMGTLWNRIELNSLNAGITALDNLLLSSQIVEGNEKNSSGNKGSE